MEVFLSAILSELTSRTINFFIGKSSKQMALDVEDRLGRVLLRAQVVVDEAMGRHITNQAMLQQLGMLIDAMHRGYYMLDTFRCQAYDEGDGKAQVVSHSLSPSRVNFLKPFCYTTKNTPILEKLQEVFDDLSSMLLDMKELALFLISYPRRYHQPYSMHLLLGNCMFGRQLDTEHVIKFLLHTQPHGAEALEVLPIVGPRKVGKSTLVAHICKDERVRGHFTDILLSRVCGFTDDELATFKEGCATRHQNSVSNSTKDGGLLVAVELDGDLNEAGWNKLYSASKRCLPSGSKIIVTSRSDKMIKFGTTQALTLKHLSREAHWYFFKTLSFGGTDPKLHPRLAYLAMQIANLLDGTLFRASITACLLRDNFNLHFWCKVLAFLRANQKRISRFGEHPFNLTDQNRPAHYRIGTPSEGFLIYHQYHRRSSEEEVPEIKFQDVIYGSVRPHGKFEALAWRSLIPPYHSYIYTCEIGEIKATGVKRKRTIRNGITLC